MAYSNPVPGGTVGRTDQGVDISAPPGTPVRAIAREQLVGITPNWYAGQPFEWFHILGTSIYDYVAEQFRGTGRIGQIFQQGQPIGSVAPSGTGLELGFATAGGQTLARATTGYREGQVTPAGRAYRSQVIDRGSKTGSAMSRNLAGLWIAAGGNPNLADTMAAIALAESRGRVNAVSPRNSNGTFDFGLWQINSSHGQYSRARLTSDPFYNAQAAVAIERSQGLGAWSTYTSGAYRSYLGGASKANYSGGASYSLTRPGGDTPGSAGGSGGGGPTPSPLTASFASLTGAPRTAPADFVSLEGDLTAPLKFFAPLTWGIGQTIQKFNDLKSLLTGAPAVINDVSSFLDFITRFLFNPLAWMRAVEFLTGLGMMAFALNIMVKDSQRSGRVHRSGLVTQAASTIFAEGRIVRALKSKGAASATTKSATVTRQPKSRSKPAKKPARRSTAGKRPANNRPRRSVPKQRARPAT